MTLAIGKSVAALEGLANRMGVIARNVVEASTDGLKKETSVLKGSDGDQVGIDQTAFQANSEVFHDEIKPTEVSTSNADLSEELPKITIVRRYFEANLKCLQCQNELVGTILDIIR